jgi:DtxR family Mn-dependent transcriptional regulator
MPRLRGPGSTESVDDYLKVIFSLSGPDEAQVSSNALADQLGIRPASVTGMLQKLSMNRPPLVKYEKHHGARLTVAGKKRALEIVRHHRLLERFLHDLLDYGWDEVHEEAERLEHFISEKFEDRIAAKLGDPQVDPHGHPIPKKSGTVVGRPEVNLLNWACGVPAVVSSVSDRDGADLRQMERLGLRPGASIVVEAGQRKTSLLVQINEDRDVVRLTQKLAAQIFVMATTDPIVSNDLSGPG